MAEMSKFDKDILEEVKYLSDRYFTFEDPFPFCGLTVYPVPLRCYNEFMVSSQCFLLNKLDDIKGIRMSNLEYLLYKIEDEKEGGEWSARFSKLIELCFHVKPGFKCEKCGHYISYADFFQKYESLKKEDLDETEIDLCDNCKDGKYVPSLISKKDDNGKRYICIDGHDIKQDDFNRMRKYVLYQNLPDYKDDSWVDKKIRDDQAAKQKILSKDAQTATLEEKIVAVCSVSSYTIDEVINLSIRKFLLLFNSVTNLIDYQANKIGIMSGLVSLPKGQKLDHWVYHKEKSLYGASVDMQSLIDQINKL